MYMIADLGIKGPETLLDQYEIWSLLVNPRRELPFDRELHQVHYSYSN